jgi:hydrogenase maturation factor
MTLPVGKLPAELLDRLLNKYIHPAEGLVVGPAVGEDAAAIDMGEKYLLVKTDPITFVADDIGRYSIHINANDIATMGGRPRWFLATILLPERSTTPQLAEEIFSQISRTCAEIGVFLCGGHTEITAGLERPVVAGMMLGEVKKGDLIRTSGARPGDDIIITKSIAIEAVSIVAREMADELTRVYGKEFVQRCRRLIESPGISVLKEAAIAVRNGEVHSMHDPTEGGIASGLWEVAKAADVGLVVYEQRIPVLPECKKLCLHYHVDHLGLIASGSLLIMLNPDDTDSVLSALKKEGVEASRIGKVLPKEEGILIKRTDSIVDLPFFLKDEITRIYEAKQD